MNQPSLPSSLMNRRMAYWLLSRNYSGTNRAAQPLKGHGMIYLTRSTGSLPVFGNPGTSPTPLESGELPTPPNPEVPPTSPNPGPPSTPPNILLTFTTATADIAVADDIDGVVVLFSVFG